MDDFKSLDIANRNHEQIFIFVQKFTDLDSLCSAIGMAYYFKNLIPEVPISIVGMSQGSKFIDTSNDWFNNSSETENQYLNGGESTKDKKTLAVLVDIPKQESVHNLKLLNLCSEIINIDHHMTDPNEEHWSKEIESKTIAKIIKTHYSSCSEIVWDLLGEVSPEIRTKELAEIIFMGLYSDTQGFISSETNTRTFQIVAEMVEAGLKVGETIRRLKNKPLSYVRLFGKLMEESQSFGNLLVLNLRPAIVYKTMPWWIGKKGKRKIRQTKLFTFPINMARENTNINTIVYVHYSLFDPWDKNKKMIFIVLDKPNEALEQVLRANKFKKNRNRWVRPWKYKDAQEFINKYLDLFSL